ncbi:hypothetical protein [Aeromonas salmonicida]|uniref:hypothetical protein n=1 Tax=Aeromonas salmonicida TaxID=645 RepID=UPI0038B8E1F0
MGMLSDILANYINIVSDTYTLMAGFVAIGIPLSLQFAGQASEKYDNATLIRYYSSSKYASPTIIMIISVLYILSSLLLKVISNNNDVGDIALCKYLAYISSFLFTLILILSAFFYHNLYRGVLKTTAQHIPLLLKIQEKPSIIKRVIPKNLIKKKGLSRYNYKDYAIVSAGLEVLIAKVKTNAWGDSYKNIISTMHFDFIKMYFGRNKDLPSKLSDVDIRFLKLYWESLLLIIKNTGESDNAELSFKTQRYLFSILGNIIHNPQYHSIVSESSYDSQEKIHLFKDVYEMARWQLHKKNEISNLFIECEWFYAISNIILKSDIRFGGDGSLSAFQCLNSIWELLVKDSPDKILSAYKNITEHLPSFHGDDFWYFTYSPFYNPEYHWARNFFRDFYNSKLTLSDGGNIDEKLSELVNGKAIIKYGQFGVSIPLSAEQYNDIIININFEDLYKKAFLYDAEFYSLKILAMLCLFNRNEEIEKCLNWRQPEDAQAHYLGNSFFPENTEQLINFISNQYHRICGDNWFYERHDLEIYVYRASLLLMKTYSGRDSINDINEVLPSKHMFSDRNKAYRILLGMSKQIDTVDFFDINQKMAIKNKFDEILILIQHEHKNQLLTTPLNNKTIEKFKSDFIDGWRSLFEKNSSILTLFSLKKTKTIQDIDVEVLRKTLKREALINDQVTIHGLNLYGESAYKYFIVVIYRHLLHTARSIGNKKTADFSGMLLFAPKVFLESNGFSFSPSNKRWEHKVFEGCFGLTCDSDEVLVVDPKTIEINLSLNCVDKSPLFILFDDMNDEDITLKMNIYYSLIIKNNSECYLLDT